MELLESGMMGLESEMMGLDLVKSEMGSGRDMVESEMIGLGDWETRSRMK